MNKRMSWIERRNQAIKEAVKLYPNISKKVIIELAKLFPMYGGTEISELTANLYWRIVYGDEMERKAR